MGFAKFVDLVLRRQLKFPRSDKFVDPWEGALPLPIVRKLSKPLFNGVRPLEQFRKIFELSRAKMFISCWFASEHESAAMWDLYSQGGDCIAVRSDLASLKVALDAAPFNARVVAVRYIDYTRQSLPNLTIFEPFIHKRLSFRHEQEVRAFVWSEEAINRPLIAEDAELVPIDVNLDMLLKGVYVAPTAKPWFGELVEHLLASHKINVPITRSDLYSRPAY